MAQKSDPGLKVQSAVEQKSKMKNRERLERHRISVVYINTDEAIY